MAAAGKTRIMIENMLRDGSLKWLIGNRSSFREELEEMGRSPSAPGNWIRELSPIANVVVRRCSKILGVPAHELQEAFNNEALNALKNPSHYARNFGLGCWEIWTDRCARTFGDQETRVPSFILRTRWESTIRTRLRRAKSSRPPSRIDVNLAVALGFSEETASMFKGNNAAGLPDRWIPHSDGLTANLASFGNWAAIVLRAPNGDLRAMRKVDWGPEPGYAELTEIILIAHQLSADLQQRLNNIQWDSNFSYHSARKWASSRCPFACSFTLISSAANKPARRLAREELPLTWFPPSHAPRSIIELSLEDQTRLSAA